MNFININTSIIRLSHGNIIVNPRYDFLMFDDIHQIDNVINSIILLKSNKNNAVTGKNIYAGKCSNIPRHKLKEFIENNKLKKTSVIQYADTVLLDELNLSNTINFLKNLKHSTYGVDKTVYDLSEHISDPKLHKFLSEFRLSYSSEKLETFFSPADGYLFFDDNNGNIGREFQNYLSKVPSRRVKFDDLYRNSVILEVLKLITFLDSNPKNIVYDHNLLESINSDGLELNDEYISTIDDMFNSRNESDIQLAVEMLNNVNLEKHSIQVAFILNKHQQKFSWGSGNKSALKNLEKYFKNKKINWRGDWRLFAESVQASIDPSGDVDQIVEKFVLDHINSILTRGGHMKSKFFKIDNLNIKYVK